MTVKAPEGGTRLDVYVASRLEVPQGSLSRSTVQRLIDSGNIVVNGRPCRPSYRVRAGDVISGLVPPPEEPHADPEDIPIDILYEDSDIIVVNKPRGMTVHPGAGNPSGTLVNALLAHCGDLSGVGGVMRPGIVHRLDKDTSGVMVVAKNDASHLELSRQFKAREVHKTYIALVRGAVDPPEGTISSMIGRHPVHRKKMAVTEHGGKPAVTRYRTIERLPGYTLLEVHPETGRTHQIRVHLAWVGHPVAGDSLYGGRDPRLPISGQALHAASLEFRHPRTGRRMRFCAPLPDDMARIMKMLGAYD
ncbi:MAG TPA: RluA family pseudouridine synthase [Firmicutes bacterium]|nr:RluA family pseudouridine synthase [Bacillota bacterium]